MIPSSQEFHVKNSMGVGDVDYRDGNLNVLNCVQKFPEIFTKSLTNAPYFLKSLQEILARNTYSFTATANTIYKMVLAQVVSQNGALTYFDIQFDSTGTTATNAVIQSGLMASVNSYPALKATATVAAANSFTVTAEAGTAIYFAQNLSNLTETASQTTYTASGTANIAITTVIAPHATAGTAIAGTNVVTITTAAAHLLRAGDYVEITTTAGFLITYIDRVPLSNNADFGKSFSSSTTCKARVGSTPSTTTFTLDEVTGNGVTNTGTITINTLNAAFLTTAGAETITTGKKLTIASVATMTISEIRNDVVATAGASGTFRVGVGGAAATRFLIEGINTNGSLNSGTITITEKAQNSQFTGTDLIEDMGSTKGGVISTNTYSQITFNFGEIGEDYIASTNSISKFAGLFFNESDADSSLIQFELYKALEKGYVR